MSSISRTILTGFVASDSALLRGRLLLLFDILLTDSKRKGSCEDLQMTSIVGMVCGDVVAYTCRYTCVSVDVEGRSGKNS
jgi:hypothetical protein